MIALRIRQRGLKLILYGSDTATAEKDPFKNHRQGQSRYQFKGSDWYKCAANSPVTRTEILRLRLITAKEMTRRNSTYLGMV
jgi:hypothetical protein